MCIILKRRPACYYCYCRLEHVFRQPATTATVDLSTCFCSLVTGFRGDLLDHPPAGAAAWHHALVLFAPPAPLLSHPCPPPCPPPLQTPRPTLMYTLHLSHTHARPQPHRHKLLMPTIATLPLLMVYYVTFNSTTVIVPTVLRGFLGISINLGKAQSVFCPANPVQHASTREST